MEHQDFCTKCGTDLRKEPAWVREIRVAWNGISWAAFLIVGIALTGLDSEFPKIKLQAQIAGALLIGMPLIWLFAYNAFIAIQGFGNWLMPKIQKGEETKTKE